MTTIKATLPSATVERVAGADRSGTAAALSARFFDSADAAFVVTGLIGRAGRRPRGCTRRTHRPSLSPRTPFPRRRRPSSRDSGRRSSTSSGERTWWATRWPRASARSPAARSFVAGADRFATAAAVADRFFRATTASVVLASGLNFPDGLSAGAVAGRPAARSSSRTRIRLRPGFPSTQPAASHGGSRQDGRVLRYTVVAHPDDDLSVWSLIGKPDPRRYDVVIVLTTGESTSYRNGRDVQNPWASQQVPPPTAADRPAVLRALHDAPHGQTGGRSWTARTSARSVNGSDSPAALWSSTGARSRCRSAIAQATSSRPTTST